MSNVKYQVQVVETDPFDIMCGECQEREVTYFVDTTLEELQALHSEMIYAESFMGKSEIGYAESFDAEHPFVPTEPDFDKWLAESIDIGYIQMVTT